jgi:hypothetical protein
MNPKIKCLKCGSYIHDTERCWNWRETRFCYTNGGYKKNCDCDSCKSKEICSHCNYWSQDCSCNIDRCAICNEHLYEYSFGLICRWDHTKSPCQFCKLLMRKANNNCPNYHFDNESLCKICNMPESKYANHKHDGTLCKICGTLLNRGKCIYKCINGGNRCIYCYWEGVVNNMCESCSKDQTGQLTKAAIK